MIRAKREPKLESKLDAFAFQAAAVQALKDREYSAVFHEQGLGKTKIGLDLVLSWLTSGSVDSSLIVTKRSLVRNWQQEIAAHTHVVPRLLTQDRNANYFALNSPARLYLTHYEVILSEEARLALFLKTRRVGILLDEAHRIKNPEASLTKSLHRLGPSFARRLIMTGTPVANRPYDIWSQIFFLDSGEALGADYKNFRVENDLTNDLNEDIGRQNALAQSLERIQASVAHMSVRETKTSSGLVLPDKIIEDVLCELEERQFELYEKYKNDLRAEVIQDGLPNVDEADDILKRLLRLVQVASNPLLVDQSYKREPGKFSVLSRILYQAFDAGEKAIVWTSFIDNAEWLGRRLREFGARVIHGSIGIDERNASIDLFKHDPGTKVLVATPGSAKEGLTLTVANHAIFFDRTFSLDDYLQAQDRIHRISQTRKCYVYNLIAKNTVDEWVDSLLRAKHSAAELVQGDISPDQYAQRMSYDYGSAIRAVLNLPEGANRHE
jgi:SNF2 family DNA or RNA helicase